MPDVNSYTIADFGKMILSHGRAQAYAEALRAAVKPGCVVVDIGAGTGIFSLLACKFGAGTVHAIEPGHGILVAQQLARLNGFGDRIVFHRALSTDVTLDTPADVVISDLRGVLPYYQRHIPAIIDARNRLLAPGGALIAQRDRLWGSLIEHGETYQQYVTPWLDNNFGVDLSAAQPYVVNTWRKVNAKPEQLLLPPQQWATLDYALAAHPHAGAHLRWGAQREGTAHGLLLWFDAELGAGFGFSNAPAEPSLIYGQAFFPLQRPALLRQGDIVSVQLRAQLVEDEYVWRWDTSVERAGSTIEKMHQSTFYAVPLDPSELQRRALSFAPRLSTEASIDKFCLNQINGTTSQETIAQRLITNFPDRFSSVTQASLRVAEVFHRYRDM